VNVKKSARTAGGLRWNNVETIFGNVQAGNLIVADDPHFDTKRLESFNNTFDVTRSATCLCAWSRRRTKKDNTQTRSRGRLPR
jgi:hypothetical protein